MDELKRYIYKLVARLLPDIEVINITAYVDDFSYSIEFWVTINGNKMQCFEMVDHGILKESDVNSLNQSIAKFIRQLPNYKKDRLNKITLTIKK